MLPHCLTNATILAVILVSSRQVLPSLASNNYFEGELERSRSFGTQLCYYTYDVYAQSFGYPMLIVASGGPPTCLVPEWAVHLECYKARGLRAN